MVNGSFVSSSVPIVALTATATLKTRETIIKSLCMQNLVLIIEMPRRDNIKLNVVVLNVKDIFKTFEWKLTELLEKGAESDRTIIYCRTKQQCNTLYGQFEKKCSLHHHNKGCLRNSMHKQTMT